MPPAATNAVDMLKNWMTWGLVMFMKIRDGSGIDASMLKQCYVLSSTARTS